MVFDTSDLILFTISICLLSARSIECNVLKLENSTEENKNSTNSVICKDYELLYQGVCINLEFIIHEDVILKKPNCKPLEIFFNGQCVTESDTKGDQNSDEWLDDDWEKKPVPDSKSFLPVLSNRIIASQQRLKEERPGCKSPEKFKNGRCQVVFGNRGRRPPPKNILVENTTTAPRPTTKSSGLRKKCISPKVNLNGNCVLINSAGNPVSSINTGTQISSTSTFAPQTTRFTTTDVPSTMAVASTGAGTGTTTIALTQLADNATNEVVNCPNNCCPPLKWLRTRCVRVMQKRPIK